MGRGQTAAIRANAAGEPSLQAVTPDTVRQSLDDLVATADRSGDFSAAEIRDAAERTTRAVADQIDRGETVTLRRIGTNFRSNLGSN